MPMSLCPTLYGSDAEHFNLYGYVTPSQAGCLSKNGLVLCISEENNTEKPTLSSVVCVPVGTCHTLYGSDSEHFAMFGYITPESSKCFSKNGVALCVSNGNTPGKPNPPLDNVSQIQTTTSVVCVPVGTCHTLYGSSTDHFSLYGYITPTSANCMSKNGLALCISDGIEPEKPTASVVSVSQNLTSSSVICVPIGNCRTLYGSHPNHFALFGYITPTQANCLSKNGLTLCISNNGQPGNPIFTTPLTTVAPTTTISSIVQNVPNPTIDLPCVPITECRVIFGTMYQHNMYYGVQKDCNRPHLRRCVAVEPYVPTTPSTFVHHPNDLDQHHYSSWAQHSSSSNTVQAIPYRPSVFTTTTRPIHDNYSSSSHTYLANPQSHVHARPVSTGVLAKPNGSTENNLPLPCAPPTHCNTIYGTSYDHFIYFGNQNSCEDPKLTRCIEAVGGIGTNENSFPTYVNPSSTTEKSETNMIFTPQMSPTQPPEIPYHSVQIIGPKPIYLSLSHVEGPKVTNLHDSSNGNTVEWRDIETNKDTKPTETPKRLYLQGASLTELFNFKGRNGRSSFLNNDINNSKSPFHQTIDRYVNSSNTPSLPSNDNSNRQKLDSGNYFTQTSSGKTQAYQKVPEKNQKHYLNVDSFEHLFFANGGKIKLPYDKDGNNTNYLFFSPKSNG